MSKNIDLIGFKYSRLTVVEKTNKKKYGKTLWKCKCDCGNFKEATSSSLKSGDVKSCGCLANETRKNNALKLNNEKHGMSHSRLYRIYHNMVSRCYRKSVNGFENYGGRGIKVCEEWLGEDGFVNFMNWALSNGYKHDLTIDRNDSNGNYEPSNCRWATHKEQANNTRKTTFLECNGEEHSISEWSEITGINANTIRSRLKRGSTVLEALGYQ